MTDAAPVQLARTLFADIGPTYDRYARLLSLGQDPRWRRFLVSRIQVEPHETVLDVATGTGAVAIELARRTGCSVVGIDQSPGMLAVGRDRVERAGLSDRIELVHGTAERLPFADDRFAGVTFTYLLRYVEDPGATLRELARVTRSGGTVASLEFGVPPAPVWRALWELYVRIVLPLAGRAISRDWHRVGRALGPTIRALPPPERIAELWRTAGIGNVQIRRLSLGGGVVIWGTRQ
jgi:demethylmenaquinone methyltransferase/2-methoxy-6-polyprenyl-1,4-benzoquinol methylase